MSHDRFDAKPAAVSRKVSSRPAVQEKMMRLWSEYHRTDPADRARRRHLKRAAERAARKLRDRP